MRERKRDREKTIELCLVLNVDIKIIMRACCGCCADHHGQSSNSSLLILMYFWPPCWQQLLALKLMNLLNRKKYNKLEKCVRHAAWVSHLKLKPSFNYFHSTCLSRPPQTGLILLSTEAQMIKCTSSHRSYSLSL